MEISEDGSGLRIDIVASDDLVAVNEHLLIGGGVPMTDDDVRELRLAQRR